MITLSVQDGDLRQGLTQLEKTKLPLATMWALNATGQDVLADLQSRMDVVFDRPTRFAKNAFHLWRATKSNLVAVVQERPAVGARHFLKVQERGGARGQTGLESLLESRLAQADQIAALIPADGARLDAFGNWSMGERNQALSAIGAQRDATSNSTGRSRARKPARAKYFVPKHGLTPGIYRRKATGKSRDIDIVAIFARKAPRYQPRFGFYDGAARVFDAQFPDHFRAALARAMASGPAKAARPGPSGPS